MDRLLYVAMSGAKETLRAQTVNNHNLANASTTGFRADLAAFQARAVDGSGYASRVYAHHRGDRLGSTSTGALLQTGRDLDVAVNGAGLDRGAGRGRHAKPTRAPATSARCRPVAAHRHGPAGDGRRRADQRSAGRVASSSAATARSRSCRWGRARRPAAIVGRIKLVNPDRRTARARRRRPVPPEGRHRRRGRRRRAGRVAARSSRATSTPPTRWST